MIGRVRSLALRVVFKVVSRVRRLRASPIDRILAGLRASRQVPVEPLARIHSDLAGLLPPAPQLVTAIVPCFNYGRLVLEAVESLFGQDYPEVEVIVVDDGSTDAATLAALDVARERGARVERKDNGGLVSARNAGAALARGEYLLFLDNDDVLEPEAVSAMLALLLEHPDAAYAYPQQHFFGDRELVWVPQEFNAYDLLWSNHPTVCSLIRRDAFEATGGYSALMSEGREDWEHWLALAERGMFGVAVRAPLFKHRRHGRTLTHAHDRIADRLNSRLIEAHQSLYSVEGVAALKGEWRPAVSVIVPFYNGHEHFEATLAALRAQSMDDFEVVVVNDGSDAPESLALLDHSRNSSEVRIIDHEVRSGPAAARNTGALAARSDLLFFLDADDLVAPTALEKLVWALLLTPSAGFVYSGVVHFGDKSGTCFDDYDPVRLRFENYLPCAVVIRRDVYLEVGGMVVGELSVHEDWDLWLRLAALRIHGRLVREPLFSYRRHARGMSTLLRSKQSDWAMRSELRRRNPGAWNKVKEPPPHCSPLQEREPGKAERCIDALGRHYLEDLAIPVESYRRPGVPNPFSASHWDSELVHVLFLARDIEKAATQGQLETVLGLDPERYRTTVAVVRMPSRAMSQRLEAAGVHIFALSTLTQRESSWPRFLDYLVMSRDVSLVVGCDDEVIGKLFSRCAADNSHVRLVSAGDVAGVAPVEKPRQHRLTGYQIGLMGRGLI